MAATPGWLQAQFFDAGSGYAADVVSERCAGHPTVVFAMAGRQLGMPCRELIDTGCPAT
ncbi:hypothetical protein [Arthrobacter sp. UYEF20]|uniref:hypothetical protein n=1 Tax=Arthrobacter sp. UYEF20 TaxID=1756363 RepID=UPI003394745B